MASPEGRQPERITGGGWSRGLPLPPGDHVLWRRDDLPAYQLGSVVADEDLGVTAIVRGVDLLESSALQLHLAAMLPAPGFRAVDLRHHALLAAPDGHKLSKSAGAQAHPLEHTDHLRAQVLHLGPRAGRPDRDQPPLSRALDAAGVARRLTTANSAIRAPADAPRSRCCGSAGRGPGTSHRSPCGSARR